MPAQARQRLSDDVADADGSPRAVPAATPSADVDAGSDLAAAVLKELPVCVTVQDAAGNLLFVNDCAAATFGVPTRNSLFAAPAAAAGTADAVICDEETLPGAAGERTLLTAQRAIGAGEGALLLSASLDITERKAVERQLERRVYFDDLTGLANRTTLERRVAHSLAAGPARRFAMVFIDLDNFKHINDYYNHSVGDALLVAVGERIAAGIRPTDLLARISGDEFVLLIDPLSDVDELRGILETCRQELTRPFYLEGFEILASGSIGASIHPEHGRDYEELRRNADSAMYRAKGTAKGTAVIFDPLLGSEVSARMALEQQLRLAIRDRSFCCAFQPKVDLRTREVVGFETLIRWRDDQGVIHPPSTFIGLATELGLIDPITLFVLEESSDMIERLDAGYGDRTTISINVAAKQASDPRFMSSFIETMRATGKAGRYMIELTEDAFVGNGCFQSQFLPALRDIGVKISIDDFGTGYSSLAVLSDITADELKIDRSFITAIHQRPRSQSVLKAIESLGHALGMSIVAEGVETFEEAAYLIGATRIRHAQGYYYSKPFYLDELTSGKPAEEARAHRSARELERPRWAGQSRLGALGRAAG